MKCYIEYRPRRRLFSWKMECFNSAQEMYFRVNYIHKAGYKFKLFLADGTEINIRELTEISCKELQSRTINIIEKLSGVTLISLDVNYINLTINMDIITPNRFYELMTLYPTFAMECNTFMILFPMLQHLDSFNTVKDKILEVFDASINEDALIYIK